MGSSRIYTCPKCRYSARVCGGRDMGMFTVMKTYTCNDCRTLSDLQIGERGIDYVDYRMPENAEKFSVDFRCPECGSKNILPWDPDKLPCPKCGIRMIAEQRSEVKWD